MTPGGEQNVQNIIVHIIQDSINEIHNINTNVTHLSKTNITKLLSKYKQLSNPWFSLVPKVHFHVYCNLH